MPAPVCMLWRRGEIFTPVRIKPRFPGHPAWSLVTILTTLFHIHKKWLLCKSSLYSPTMTANLVNNTYYRNCTFIFTSSEVICFLFIVPVLQVPILYSLRLESWRLKTLTSKMRLLPFCNMISSDITCTRDD